MFLPHFDFFFNITQKPAFAHYSEDEKMPFDVIYDLYKMKQFRWFLCVANNCDCSRKIRPCTVKPDSRVTSRGIKTYSERGIELQNLQILKKMLEKSSQFLSSE